MVIYNGKDLMKTKLNKKNKKCQLKNYALDVQYNFINIYNIVINLNMIKIPIINI